MGVLVGEDDLGGLRGDLDEVGVVEGDFVTVTVPERVWLRVLVIDTVAVTDDVAEDVLVSVTVCVRLRLTDGLALRVPDIVREDEREIDDVRLKLNR